MLQGSSLSLLLCLSLQSLMSTTAFGLGSKYFALYEVAGVGIQWRTINQSPVEGDDFNLLLSMVMLIIDATVYGVLTWYIEAVHPGKPPPLLLTSARACACIYSSTQIVRGNRGALGILSGQPSMSVSLLRAHLL